MNDKIWTAVESANQARARAVACRDSLKEIHTLAHHIDPTGAGRACEDLVQEAIRAARAADDAARAIEDLTDADAEDATSRPAWLEANKAEAAFKAALRLLNEVNPVSLYNSPMVRWAEQDALNAAARRVRNLEACAPNPAKSAD